MLLASYVRPPTAASRCGAHRENAAPRMGITIECAVTERLDKRNRPSVFTAEIGPWNSEAVRLGARPAFPAGSPFRRRPGCTAGITRNEESLRYLCLLKEIERFNLISESLFR